MNTWLSIVILILLGHYVLELVIELCNRKSLEKPIPPEVQGIYKDQNYQESIAYQKERSSFNIIQSSINFACTTAFLIFGGFGLVDTFAKSFAFPEIGTGLVFAASISLLSFLLGLPFTLYSIFVIEDRFGFNKITPMLFLLDTLKGALLFVTLGGALFSLVQWFFISFETYGWLYCWVAVVLFSFIIQFLAPAFILPIFNTFTPLPNGPLRNKLLEYASKENFLTQGIYTMDGSKRSTKLNAFFVGFGKFRKIALFDTLLDKLDDNEILAVLAHEVGHFKLKHIWKMMFGSILQMGLLLYLLSFFLNYPVISRSFGVAELHVYSSMIFFGFIYSPLSTFLGLFYNYMSRKHEFAADLYSAQTTNNPHALMSGLRKLSQANLAHLTPHPLKVFVTYTHPPLLERLRQLGQLIS